MSANTLLNVLELGEMTIILVIFMLLYYR